jgi:hypothetical protein
LYGTLLVNLISFLHLRLSKEKAFAGAYHGSGESRVFQLKSGHPRMTVTQKLKKSPQPPQPLTAIPPVQPQVAVIPWWHSHSWLCSLFLHEVLMSTLRQIEANRRNAAKSTGPRSVEGKAVSSRNALQSGIHAESVIITDEDPEALTQLAETFYRDHQPETAMERALLDNIIRDTWLLTRFFRIDAEIIDYKIEDALYKKEDNQAGRAFIDSSPHQSRLQRRINDTRRSQIQGFKELQRLQSERRAQPPAPQPQPPARPLDVTAPPSTPKEQIGFVPQEPSQSPAVEPISHPPAARTRVSAVPRIGFAA